MQACIKTAIQTSAYIKSCKSVECFCGILLCAFVINKNAPKDVFVLCDDSNYFVPLECLLWVSFCQRSRQLFRTIVKTNGCGGLSALWFHAFSIVPRIHPARSHAPHYNHVGSCTQARTSSHITVNIFA